LADLIGELKRLSYDKIRVGNGDEASFFFDIMENLYILILPFAAYDHVVPGIRRKLDVCKLLVENTRSAVTEEIRREEFILSINKLSDKIMPYLSKKKVI
jgi:translin